MNELRKISINLTGNFTEDLTADFAGDFTEDSMEDFKEGFTGVLQKEFGETESLQGGQGRKWQEGNGRKGFYEGRFRFSEKPQFASTANLGLLAHHW